MRATDEMEKEKSPLELAKENWDEEQETKGYIRSELSRLQSETIPVLKKHGLNAKGEKKDGLMVYEYDFEELLKVADSITSNPSVAIGDGTAAKIGVAAHYLIHDIENNTLDWAFAADYGICTSGMPHPADVYAIEKMYNRRRSIMNLAKPREEKSRQSKLEHEKWRKEAERIQSDFPSRKMSKRELAPKVKRNLGLLVSEDWIERNL